MMAASGGSNKMQEAALLALLAIRAARSGTLENCDAFSTGQL
jgi:hypothetical protein